MDLTAWAFYALIVSVALAATLLHYRRREPPGRGRTILALLRWLAIAVVALLLFDPALPSREGAGGGSVVLLDASLSMRLPDEGGTTRWERAREQATAESAASDAPILLFGGGVAVAAESLDGAEPAATESRLAPAVRSAAEAGARRVVAFTDAGLVDLREARATAATAGIELEVRRVGGDVDNAGITEVRAPGWTRAGEEVAVELEVAATRPGDTMTVVLRREGRELARTTVASPAPGRVSTATLRFTPAAGAGDGPVRFEAALAASDAEPDDDVRPFYIRITDDPAGAVLVTFRPDQEPRFLLPVLERALGVPTRGWLALPAGRFIRLGLGPEAGVTGDETDVRRALRSADLVVLHGVDDAAPAWARDAVGDAGRLLLFPAAPLDALPVSIGPERPGDWYVVADVPSSPVAPLMAGMAPGDAPPLTALRPGTTAPEGFWSPLMARLGRRGPPQPVVLAGAVDGRRIAVATGEGYWRWAFAGGASRDVYERLWAAVGGWLMAEAGATAADGVRPADRVLPRGRPVEWVVPGGVDSLRVSMRPVGDTAGGASTDTVVAVEGARAYTASPSPGTYAYTVAAADGSAVGGSGELAVESYSPEFTRPSVSLEPVDGAVEGAEGEGAGRRERPLRQGRPLHTAAWPYVLVILLLCGEWILRRRWGLR